MRQIAIYGKGGIGKSTTTQNVAAALSKNNKVLIVGCDPKADSSRLILGRNNNQTALDILKEKDLEDITIKDIINTGYNNIDTVELGGPEPGIGCAGRGIATGIKLLENLSVYNNNYDYILYDVLGDVVCGGFATPIKEGKAEEIYIVCSGEMMSLYAANNICKGIKHYANAGKTKLGGIICNSRLVDNEKELVEEFANKINSKLLYFIPRNNIVQKAEINRKTVIEYDDTSSQADEYKSLAYALEKNNNFTIPTPLTKEELEELLIKYEGGF